MVNNRASKSTSSLRFTPLDRAALLLHFISLGAYNKGYTVWGSARPSPKFFFRFVLEKLRISPTLCVIFSSLQEARWRCCKFLWLALSFSWDKRKITQLKLSITLTKRLRFASPKFFSIDFLKEFSINHSTGKYKNNN